MSYPLPQASQATVSVDKDKVSEESAENFKKFIFELFDKNGILNDLRAYLRGHIVNVLKSAQTEKQPAFQKHFTQRLDLTFQALNMLVAEYLLRLEFSYSFSVFISEIPLGNMIFEFAKTLMHSGSSDNIGLRFKDTDVWSILNYLGIKCDSNHATSISEMYKAQGHYPLLLCILKNIPMYSKESDYNHHTNSSNNNMSSSRNSSDSLVETPTKESNKKSLLHEKCRHYVSCKSCQSKITRVKEKYTRKKKNFAKNVIDIKLEPRKVENLMRNINAIERSLIDEMFQQLKTVYEAELEMVRDDKEKKVKRCHANHAFELQQRQDKMEISFKARTSELESNVEQKKKFLWGLARSLRGQHEHMTRAMRDVRLETDRLTDKEESLKAQLAEAEQILIQRGEEMRTQISNELIVLEAHLDSMKRERENIDRERSELEHLKVLHDSKDKSIKHNIDIDDLKPHYELLKNELSILKKYIDSSRLEPKCVIERSTMTELRDVTCKLNIVLNNGRDIDYNNLKHDEIRCGNSGQLVNDLKKQKNVNFSQSNLDEIYRERSRERSRSSASSEGGDSAPFREMPHRHDLILELRQENDRLKAFSTQQREHIEDLSREQNRLQVELIAERIRQIPDVHALAARPRTAPTFMPQPNNLSNRVNANASAYSMNFGYHKGAGEELSLFSKVQPRIYLPDDNHPFIGTLRDRHLDNRRHLISEWRMLRRRSSPVRVMNKNRISSVSRSAKERQASAGPGVNASYKQPIQDDDEDIQIRSSDIRKDNEKVRIQVSARETSPNTVLREAKLRLRKLEIEAEAVEKSYIDFRDRQLRLRNDKPCLSFIDEEANVGYDDKNSDLQQSNIPPNVDATSNDKYLKKSVKTDCDRYIREYKTMRDLEASNFRNRNLSIDLVRPIPETYSVVDRKDKVNDYYLETPLTEFRKLYHSSRPRTPKQETKTKPTSQHPDCNKCSLRKPNLTTELCEVNEVILNENAVNKQSTLNDSAGPSNNEIANILNGDNCSSEIGEENILRVEVESAAVVSGLQITDSQTRDILLVVESASSNNSEEIKSISDGRKQITILVRPKGPNSLETHDAINISPEPIANPTESKLVNDIFCTNNTESNISSVQIHTELSKDVISQVEEEDKKDEEYPDDFSADVDNYNIQSDYERNSPISLPKTSEDDNFWDS